MITTKKSLLSGAALALAAPFMFAGASAQNDEPSAAELNAQQLEAFRAESEPGYEGEGDIDLGDAAADAAEWSEDAADDIGEWTEDAVEDAGEWIDDAADDVSDAIDDAFEHDYADETIDELADPTAEDPVDPNL